MASPCWWEELELMEYPPKERTLWKVTAYDRNGKPMLHAKECGETEAKDLGDKWFARTDVSRVEGGPYDG